MNCPPLLQVLQAHTASRRLRPRAQNCVPHPFAHLDDKRRSFGIIATLPVLPISKGPPHPLRIALYSGSAISRGSSPNLRGWKGVPTYPCTRVQAQIGAQAVREFVHTEAAQLARKAQRTASHRSAQKGGVLYASEARNIAAVGRGWASEGKSTNVFDWGVDQPLLLDHPGRNIIYRTQHAPPSSQTL